MNPYYISQNTNEFTFAERSAAQTMRIGKEDVPRANVLERFRELNRFHIEYIFDCLEESRPNIRNIRGYLLTAL